MPVEYAGFWVRFAAVFVDGLVLLIPNGIIIFALKGGLLANLLSNIVSLAYVIYMLNTKQATLGKMAVGLKVTSIDGNKPKLGKLFIREIGKILSAIIIYIGFLMVAFTKKKQGLHDKLANTVVIYDPAKKRRPWIVVISIIFLFIIPIVVFFASIVLVSLNSARIKAKEAAFQSEAKMTVPAMLIACNDKGKITIGDLGSPKNFNPAAAIKTLEYNCNPEDEENWGFSITINGINGLESKSATCTENGCEFN